MKTAYIVARMVPIALAILMFIAPKLYIMGIKDKRSNNRIRA